MWSKFCICHWNGLTGRPTVLQGTAFLYFEFTHISPFWSTTLFFAIFELFPPIPSVITVAWSIQFMSSVYFNSCLVVKISSVASSVRFYWFYILGHSLMTWFYKRPYFSFLIYDIKLLLVLVCLPVCTQPAQRTRTWSCWRGQGWRPRSRRWGGSTVRWPRPGLCTP